MIPRWLGSGLYPQLFATYGVAAQYESPGGETSECVAIVWGEDRATFVVERKLLGVDAAEATIYLSGDDLRPQRDGRVRVNGQTWTLVAAPINQEGCWVCVASRREAREKR